MSFPAAVFAVVGLLVLGVFVVSAACAGVHWVLELITRRIPAPRWMGISDWAGPLFVLSASMLAGLTIWLFA